MRPVGFSTGALSHGDFRAALRMLGGKPVGAVELSALREPELLPLSAAIGALSLSSFAHVSVHAPSSFPAERERDIAGQLLHLARRGLPIVLHPDAIVDFAPWADFGAQLLVENMDLRKRTGQTAADLEEVFARLPRAGLCFDLGHAWQVDPSLKEARTILHRFGPRLRQLHVSEVGKEGRHRPLSPAAIAAFQTLAPLIPEHVPLVLEGTVPEAELDAEIERAHQALG